MIYFNEHKNLSSDSPNLYPQPGQTSKDNLICFLPNHDYSNQEVGKWVDKLIKDDLKSHALSEDSYGHPEGNKDDALELAKQLVSKGII